MTNDYQIGQDVAQLRTQVMTLMQRLESIEQYLSSDEGEEAKKKNESR